MSDDMNHILFYLKSESDKIDCDWGTGPLCWGKLWKWEEKDFNSMWVSEVSNKFTKNEMEIEKPEGIVC